MKTSKTLTSVLVISTIAFWFSFVFFVESAGAATFAVRTSDAAGVQVTVTPKLPDSSAGIWEFEVIMNTHAKPLSADLAQSAVLTDDTGRRYAPLAWQGDPPGGHHRKGILRFPMPEGEPKAVELKLNDIGEVGERVFQWDIE